MVMVILGQTDTFCLVIPISTVLWQCLSLLLAQLAQVLSFQMMRISKAAVSIRTQRAACMRGQYITTQPFTFPEHTAAQPSLSICTARQSLVENCKRMSSERMFLCLLSSQDQAWLVLTLPRATQGLQSPLNWKGKCGQIGKISIRKGGC